MPATQRRLEPGVIERLLAAPHRFSFPQAVRLLETWLRQHGAGRGRPPLDYLRFQNSLSLSFPPSQIEALTINAGAPATTAAALLAALRDGRLASITITPAFMGLLGGNGALPLHYTESIAAALARTKDEGARAFLDLLSNRQVALFYQAWNKHRLEYQRQTDGGDRFQARLLMLSGRVPTPANADAIFDQVRAHYAAMIRHRPVSASVIAAVLSEYFALPIAVEQCVGGWDVCQPDELPRLGGGNTVLGRGYAVGPRSWRCDLRARLRIGPLNKADFDDFLPGAGGALALKKMMAMFAVPVVRFEVRLVLRAPEVPRWRLGQRLRLGWETFLLSAPEARDRDDVRYEL